MGANSFSRHRRLRNAADYKRVFDAADSRASHKHLLLLGRYNHQPQCRLGLVIAKKHVKLAARRNRIKRVTREFFRCCPAIENNLDVIMLARQGVDQLDNATLSSILRQQWQKLTAP
ncbi:MAG: ribonuclease P protein component [Gammaproteobacteria bacterium]|nr:ribonuclease P protein component [Gammaproteobacteria bacterium]